MVDKVTMMIEKAIQSNSDEEALACLRQVRKVYQGTGSVVMPRRDRQPADENVLTNVKNMVPIREHDQTIKSHIERINTLERQNIELNSENDQLKTEKIKGAIAADEEVVADALERIRRAVRHAVAGWTVAVVVVVILAIMVL